MRNARLGFHLLASLFLAYATAFLGSFFTTREVLSTWYTSLHKAVLNPPSFVFAPVWTLLYTLMAFAAWRIYERRSTDPRSYRALVVYVIHLAVNAGWSFVFFGMQAPALALGVIGVLFLMVLTLTIMFFRIDRTSGYLFLPYLLWISFASYLNLSVVLLN